VPEETVFVFEALILKMSTGKSKRGLANEADNEKLPSWVAGFKEEMRLVMQKTLDDSLLAIQTSLNLIDSKTAQLEVRSDNQAAVINQIRDDQYALEARISKLECRSMRENLIFSGIPEVDDEDVVALTKSIMSIITDVLEIDLNDINILTCHRLRYPSKAKKFRTSQQSDDRPRSVVVRLSHKDEVSLILQSAKKLKGHEPRIFINQQYPPDVASKRRILQPVFHQAKEQRLKSSFNEDRLYIEGKLHCG
jgi:hypothetical protein